MNRPGVFNPDEETQPAGGHPLWAWRILSTSLSSMVVWMLLILLATSVGRIFGLERYVGPLATLWFLSMCLVMLAGSVLIAAQVRGGATRLLVGASLTVFSVCFTAGGLWVFYDALATRGG